MSAVLDVGAAPRAELLRSVFSGEVFGILLALLFLFFREFHGDSMWANTTVQAKIRALLSFVKWSQCRPVFA